MLWINSIALFSSDHPSSIQNHWSIQSGFPLSPQRHVFQGVHLQKCGEVLGCFGSDTSNHFQTSPRSSAQRRLLQHYEWSGFPLSPQLNVTSKPRQNHLLINEGIGRTEYLINMWATNWVFKSIECFESTAQLCPLLTILLAYKIIGGYGVDSRSLPNSKKCPNHNKIICW
jgi:hypothetical protein